MSYSFPSRLGWDKGCVGPDFSGCVNSGHAPVILKSRSAATYLDKPFMVGGSFMLKYARVECISAAMKGKRTEDMKRYKVRFFKTYAGAKKHFLKLMEPVKQDHAEARKARAKLAEAKEGTPEYMNALLGAADYGIV